MKSIAYENVYLYRCLRWLHVRRFGDSWRDFRRALHAAERPSTTIVRIAWFVLVGEFLGRFRAGRCLADGLTAARRRWLRRP